MKKIKVLIADDSIIYRSQIKGALSEIEWIEIVGAAANGKIAFEKVRQNHPDLLILDLEMPEMDGLQTLKAIADSRLPGKILIFSSSSKRGAQITLEALRLGASDFITKPGQDSNNSAETPSQKIRALLEEKIKGLFPERFSTTSESDKSTTPATPSYPAVSWPQFTPRVIVVASSTGGPTVLETIFSKLSPPLNCPILIAQHMPPIFTATLAERLQKISGINCKEGAHDEPLSNDTAYIAPGNFHMSIAGSPGSEKIALDQGPQINSVRPAANPLFESAARIYGNQCLGIVLTGMGEDGKVGAQKIKEAAGAVLIQSEASCTVFGMPGAVKNIGAYDLILTPNEIIEAIQQKAGGKNV